MEDVAEVILLTRGVRDVTSLLRDQLQASPISGLLFGHHMPDDEKGRVRLPEAVLAHWDEVQAMICDQCVDDALAICLEAWRELKDIYMNVKYFKQLQRLESGVVWRWPVSPSLFVRARSSARRLNFPPRLPGPSRGCRGRYTTSSARQSPRRKCQQACCQLRIILQR